MAPDSLGRSCPGDYYGCQVSRNAAAWSVLPQESSGMKVLMVHLHFDRLDFPQRSLVPSDFHFN